MAIRSARSRSFMRSDLLGFAWNTLRTLLRSYRTSPPSVKMNYLEGLFSNHARTQNINPGPPEPAPGASPMTSAPLAMHEYRPGGLDPAMEFLKRTRSELRLLRMVRVGKDFLRVYDVNGDAFEIRGLGYPDA